MGGQAPLRGAIDQATAGYRRIASAAGGLSDIISVVGTVAGIFGLTLSKAATDAAGLGLPKVPIETAPLPVRLVVFILLAAGLGWTLGVAVRLLRRLSRDMRLMLGALAAVVLAGLLAGLADWLVAPRRATDLPQQLMLTLAGVLVAVRCLVENLAARRGIAGPGDVGDRALVPLVFVLASALMLAIAEMGAQ